MYIEIHYSRILCIVSSKPCEFFIKFLKRTFLSNSFLFLKNVIKIWSSLVTAKKRLINSEHSTEIYWDQIDLSKLISLFADNEVTTSFSSFVFQVNTRHVFVCLPLNNIPLNTPYQCNERVVLLGLHRIVVYHNVYAIYM